MPNMWAPEQLRSAEGRSREGISRRQPLGPGVCCPVWWAIIWLTGAWARSSWDLFLAHHQVGVGSISNGVVILNTGWLRKRAIQSRITGR